MERHEINVTKQEFDIFINNYPRKIAKYTVTCATPNIICYCDDEIDIYFVENKTIACHFDYWEDTPEEERRYMILENVEEYLDWVKGKDKSEFEEMAREYRERKEQERKDGFRRSDYDIFETKRKPTLNNQIGGLSTL